MVRPGDGLLTWVHLLDSLDSDVKAVGAELLRQGRKAGEISTVLNVLRKLRDRLASEDKAAEGLAVAPVIPAPADADWGSCLKKSRYKTAEAAGRAAARAREQGSTDVLRIYACPYCERYHLTKMTLAEQAAVTERRVG